MPDRKDFDATFKTLRGLLKPYAKRLGVQDDKPNQYSVSLSDVQDRVGRPLFFGCVRKGKAYAGLQIPPDFTRDLRAGRTARVQVLIDGSNSTTALQALTKLA